MKNNIYKVIGAILCLIGGIWLFVLSISVFFGSSLIGYKVTYNTVGIPQEPMLIYEMTLFVCGIIMVILSLMTFKHHHLYRILVAEFIIGVICIFFLSTGAGVLIIIGTLCSMIAINYQNKKSLAHSK
ncbi:hypothetical protein [Fangia hongkongensis]|uniref:hypothetical protein n=1 Tax=Fangia hongkongensis TaxID=270495 RepID=UPI00036E85BE|nr:hypothetical protein [Fangia hongkongensis]MBK2124910.1 hypothetical protein [Fangia hongkongensis]